MVEDTVLENGEVVVKTEVSEGQEVLPMGADIFSGQRVLRSGDRLFPAALGAIAATGRVSVPVRVLRVGIIATGDELAEPGRPLLRGQIYNSNTFALATAIRRLGAFPVSYGVVGDDPAKAAEVFLKALDECNLVLTTGSTSAGTDDFMYDIIGKHGKILIHGIRFKPGKPMIIALAGGIPVMGLPGNPTSAMMLFNELVSGLILRGLGIAPPSRKKMRGTLMADLHSDNRLEYSAVKLVRDLVYPLAPTSAFNTTLAKADGFIAIDPDVSRLERGCSVEVTLFENAIPADLSVAGGVCYGPDILENVSGLHFRLLENNSAEGLAQVIAGQADIAAVNPGVRVPEGFVRIRGYSREMGLAVAVGSPIKGVGDLPGRVFMNRCEGSGARILFDEVLRWFAGEIGMEFKELRASIGGYASQARTPFEVCHAIKTGIADAGFVPRPFAGNAGLAFIPLTTDNVDFIIPESIAELRETGRFLEALRSAEFGSRLPAGLRTDERTGTLL
jgi:putative molybdopterin biosynthesis protein